MKNFDRDGGLDGCLSVLDLDRLRAASLSRDPFDFIVVEEFVRREALARLLADFPQIRRHGSFPVDSLAGGPGFAGPLAGLTGGGVGGAIADKIGLELGGLANMVAGPGR